MNILEILMIAVGLAMDAFAVSIAAGTSGKLIGKRATFRLSFHFGLFQALMPVIGWFAGVHIDHLIAAVDHWFAFGLLLFVGGRMILSSNHGSLVEINKKGNIANERCLMRIGRRYFETAIKGCHFDVLGDDDADALNIKSSRDGVADRGTTCARVIEFLGNAIHDTNHFHVIEIHRRQSDTGKCE